MIDILFFLNSLYGIFMEFLWNLYGIYMEFFWYVYFNYREREPEKNFFGKEIQIMKKNNRNQDFL